MMNKPVKERFLEKIDKQPNGCWLWTGAIGKDGYGIVKAECVTMSAHRLSFILFKQEPGDLQVLHRCDVPNCVNPEHLFLGTQQQNLEDAIAKGRRAAHKLTDEQVREIRKLDFMPPSKIQKYYPQVSRALIGQVQKRLQYKEVV